MESEAQAVVLNAFQGTPLAEAFQGLVCRGPGYAFLSGGFVRDALLRREPITDIDVTLADNPAVLAASWASGGGGTVVPLDPLRGTFRVVVTADDRIYNWDLNALRAPTIEDDLRRRDFTINAMAVDLCRPDGILDPTGGLADLRRTVLRIAHPDALIEDPLRKLRAYRFAAQLGFAIDPATRELLGEPDLFLTIAGERIRHELAIMLAGRSGPALFAEAISKGLLRLCFPPESLKPDVLQELNDIICLIESSSDAWACRLLKERAGHDLVFKAILFLVVPIILHAADYHHPLGPALSHGKAVTDLLHLGRKAGGLLSSIIQSYVDPRSAHGVLSEEEYWIYFDKYGLGGIGGALLRMARQRQDFRVNNFIGYLAEFYYQRFLPDIKAARPFNAEDISRISGIPPGPALGELVKKAQLARRLGRLTSIGDLEAYLKGGDASGNIDIAPSQEYK